MVATTKSRFVLRAIAGVFLMFAGLYLALTFKESSHWGANVKAIMIATAYSAAIGGVALFASYQQQAEFKQMKSSLVAMAGLLAIFLLTQLMKLI